MTAAPALAANGGIPAGLRRKLDACDDAQGHAAGIVFVAPDGDILLLRRSGEETNFAHHWALPGGGVEDGETPEIGAAREAREEVGFDADPAGFKIMDRSRTPNGLAFHTFAMPVKEKFVPKLNAEHAGYAWTPLSSLPQPLHPAVAKTLQDRVGITAETTAEDANGLRDGFVKWSCAADSDLRDEPVHSMIKLDRQVKDITERKMQGMDVDLGATDSALLLALDRDTVREKDRDGRLKIRIANISKANVCPYRGREIPGWEKLGLEPDRIYNLLRDPEELRKAAASSNGVPLLRKHVKVSADDHQPYDVVGSLGSHGDFDGKFLTNSVYVNARDAIDDIESKKKRELSMGYHYTPDMTAGKFGGMGYDGVMRDIIVNHVALVEDGRAGPDVVVGDSMENLNMKTTRLAVTTLGITAAAIAPLLAMDAKLPVELFNGLTAKNFAASKTGLLTGIRKSLDNRLRSGLAMDASIESVEKLLDLIGEGSGADEEAPDDAVEKMKEIAQVEPVAAAKTTYDAEPLKKFLMEKGLGEDDIGAAMGMLPNAQATDEDDLTDEEKAKKKAEAEKKDKGAEDKMVSKTAMDEALKKTRKEVADEIRTSERAIRVALAEVKPWIGELPASIAFDSAEGVYRHTLKALGHTKHATIHSDALNDVLRSMPKPNERKHQVSSSNLGMDESSISKAAKFAPGLDRIKTLA